MRRLVYYVAVTLDGFIARPDGSFDCFLWEGPHFPDLIERFPETFPSHYRAAAGIAAEPRHFDTVLMGRHTYEVGLREGIANPYPHLRQYVVSTTLRESPDPGVHLHRGDPLDLVRRLKAEDGPRSAPVPATPPRRRKPGSGRSAEGAPPAPGPRPPAPLSAPKDVWICGGAKLAAALAPEIDEMILKINPVVIGNGIPLFDGAIGTRPGTLLEHKPYENGFVLARYRLL